MNYNSLQYLLQFAGYCSSSDISIPRLTPSQHPHNSSSAVEAHTVEYSDNHIPLAQPPPLPRHLLLVYLNLDAPALPPASFVSAAQTCVSYLSRCPALAAAVTAPADEVVAGGNACGCTHTGLWFVGSKGY